MTHSKKKKQSNMTTKKIPSLSLGKVMMTLLLILSAKTAVAQEHVGMGPLHSSDSPREDWILPGDTIYRDGKPLVYSGKPLKNPITPSLSNESSAIGNAPYNIQPQPTTMKYALGLHQGLNMSIDLSAFATFGKHTPHRGGFTQTIDAAYLTPLTKDGKLWMALGAYVNNINYGGDNFHDGGVYGMFGYKINEHWETYIYGQLSVANNYNSIMSRYGGYGPYGYTPWGYGPWGYGMTSRGMTHMGYGMGLPGANVLGAGVKYTNKNFSLGINVEAAWYNNKTPSYYKQYDYPIPEAPGDK